MYRINLTCLSFLLTIPAALGFWVLSMGKWECLSGGLAIGVSFGLIHAIWVQAFQDDYRNAKMARNWLVVGAVLGFIYWSILIKCMQAII